MSKEISQNSEFKIKFYQIEFEYSGKNAEQIFEKVFEFVKSLPLPKIENITKSDIQNPSSDSDSTNQKQNLPEENKPNYFIAKDSQMDIDEINQLIIFKKEPAVPYDTPILHNHPNDLEDAIVLITYAIQMGLQKFPIELVDLKKILKINGYALVGRNLGEALVSLRRKNYMTASQTKGQYKPHTLVKEGIERARLLLKPK